MKAFLMTYLSFTNPKTLLLKLMERYHVPPSSHSPAEIKRIQLRVCNVLKNWVVQYFDDFDHELIQTVVTFVDEHLDRDGHDSITKILRNAIVKRVGSLAISDIYVSVFFFSPVNFIKHTRPQELKPEAAEGATQYGLIASSHLHLR